MSSFCSHPKQHNPKLVRHINPSYTKGVGGGGGWGVAGWVRGQGDPS